MSEHASWTQPETCLDRYLAEIAQYPLLSAEQECTLARRAQAGDECARTRFLHAHLRLVVSVAKRYQGFGVDLLDLIQEGNLGLMQALDQFDPARGSRFSSYATYWLRQAITRALDKTARPIRLPSHVVARLRTLERVCSQYTASTGSAPTPEVLADLLGLSASSLADLLHARSLRTLSLDAPLDDEDGGSLADYLADETSPAPEARLCQQDERDERLTELDALLSCLTLTEQIVLVMYHSPDGPHAHCSFAQMGRVLGLSRERVRRLYTRALTQVREHHRAVEELRARLLRRAAVPARVPEQHAHP